MDTNQEELGRKLECESCHRPLTYVGDGEWHSDLNEAGLISVAGHTDLGLECADCWVARRNATSSNEIARLKEALQDIVDWPRDDGLAAMCNQMRGRAAAALGGD